MSTDAPAARINPAKVAVDVIAGVLIIAGITAAVLAVQALNRAQLVLAYRGLDSSPESVAATTWIWVGAVAAGLGVVLLLVRLLAAALKP